MFFWRIGIPILLFLLCLPIPPIVHVMRASSGNRLRIGSARSASPEQRCRRRFLRYFPGGFGDPTYLEWERGYKWRAHAEWALLFNRHAFRQLLLSGRALQAAAQMIRIEGRTNLLFSFEKMAIRDAVRLVAGARRLVAGLYDLLYGGGSDSSRFARWCEVVAALPRRGTRVSTWPVVTVFPFLAAPDRHVFLKPNVTRIAAREYGFDFDYRSRPDWETYASLLAFAAHVRRDLRDLRPRDMIDIQSFLWVQGSDEYPD